MFHDLDDRVNVVNKEGFISPVERSSSRVIVFSKHKRTKGGTVLVEHDSRVKEQRRVRKEGGNSGYRDVSPWNRRERECTRPPF